MATIDPSALDDTMSYRLAIGTVVPRPIAWITTLSREGIVNLAAFSFFAPVCAKPFILAVAIAHRQPPKDTRRNLQQTGEAVVHLVPPDLVEACNASGAEYAPDISEVAELGLTTLPSTVVAVPRLAAAPVALECRFEREIELPDIDLCLLQVRMVHVDDAVMGPKGLPDPERLRVAARLGERAYLLGDGKIRSLPVAKPPPGKGLERMPL